MKFKCPVNYNINNCSSKEYGLTCETCFHSEDEEYLIKQIKQLKEGIKNGKD